MLDNKELLKLMKLSVTAESNSPAAYSFGDEKFSAMEINDALRTELNQLAGDYAMFRENKNIIFRLIEQTIDDVLPAKVLEQYGTFADIQTVAQGEKPVFTQHITQASKMRAKQFVTKVGLAGVYETFKLDGKRLEITSMAYGGAAMISLEEFLDGRVTFADVLDVVMMALDEAIYREIAKALIASIANLPTANKYAGAGFSEAAMDKLVAIADAYGKAAIYCTYEFAATVNPAATGTAMSWVSEDMKNARWNNGYLANYKGHSVIVLPQSFEDDQNAKKIINPAYAWIIPTGGYKPVKIAFEGQTITQDFGNRDGSREVQVYKKIGVGTLVTNNVCSYKNTSLDSLTW